MLFLKIFHLWSFLTQLFDYFLGAWLTRGKIQMFIQSSISDKWWVYIYTYICSNYTHKYTKIFTFTFLRQGFICLLASRNLRFRVCSTMAVFIGSSNLSQHAVLLFAMSDSGYTPSGPIRKIWTKENWFSKVHVTLQGARRLTRQNSCLCFHFGQSSLHLPYGLLCMILRACWI